MKGKPALINEINDGKNSMRRYVCLINGALYLVLTRDMPTTYGISRVTIVADEDKNRTNEF